MNNEIHPIPTSNLDKDGNYIDRIYGNLNGSQRLVQADGSQYTGTIHKKSIIITGIDGNRFKSHVYVTDDKRWFDRSGMPIEEPKKVEPEDDVVVEKIEYDE